MKFRIYCSHVSAKMWKKITRSQGWPIRETGMKVLLCKRDPILFDHLWTCIPARGFSSQPQSSAIVPRWTVNAAVACKPQPALLHSLRPPSGPVWSPPKKAVLTRGKEDDLGRPHFQTHPNLFRELVSKWGPVTCRNLLRKTWPNIGMSFRISSWKHGQSKCSMSYYWNFTRICCFPGKQTWILNSSGVLPTP